MSVCDIVVIRVIIIAPFLQIKHDIPVDIWTVQKVIAPESRLNKTLLSSTILSSIMKYPYYHIFLHKSQNREIAR